MSESSPARRHSSQDHSLLKRVEPRSLLSLAHTAFNKETERAHVTFKSLATLLVAAAAVPVNLSAQTVTLDQYLMTDRQAEITLARSATPAALSDHAQVLVLGRSGYEVAVAGTNGFVCMVERSWMGPFDDPNFWNPRIRGPICYSPAAVASILPLVERRTALVLAHRSKDEILDSMRAGPHRDVAPGAIGYMLSKDQYLGNGPWMPHLMFFVPLADTSQWAADVAGSPVISFTPYAAEHEPIAVYLVPVRAWSDGSPAQDNPTNRARRSAARR